MMRRLTCVLLLCLFFKTAFAIEINSTWSPNTSPKQVSKALRLVEASSIAPLAVLRPAEIGAMDQLESISVWNSSGKVPARNGFARPIPSPKSLRFTSDLLIQQPSRLAGGVLLAPPSGGLAWGAAVEVKDAYRIRLHLSNVRLPAGTLMWVYSEDGNEEVAFRAEDVATDREIWTPSVAGPVARFEIRLPEGDVEGYGFTIDQVLELFDLGDKGAPERSFPGQKQDLSCLKDAACYNDSALSGLNLYKHAVAHLQFVQNGQSYICSGALMNDSDDSSFIPYFLTAHHCFDTQTTASSLEAFFDYIASSCLGTAPSLGTVPRTVGATLLATSESTDFTLVRLSSLPPGRGLLGLTSTAASAGTVLHRLSHPLGLPMGYSVATVTSGGPSCQGLPRPNFLYSTRLLGGTLGGSSGSPVVRGSDARVVGQLLGVCGPTAVDGEGCDSANSVVDGAMSGTWSSISQWLGATTPTPGVCTPTSTALCLGSGGRFRVEATFDTGSQQGQAQVVKLTDETGYLWFFSAGNVEAVVKVLDACSFNQRFWVYAGGLTNVRVALTVTDTKTGTAKVYTNPRGTAFQPIQDTSAFATCP